MDKKLEAQRLADEAKAKMRGNREDGVTDEPIAVGTPRLDNLPTEQPETHAVVARQTEAQEIAEKQEAAAIATANYNATQELIDDQTATSATTGLPKAPKAKKEKLVEVLLKRKYAPVYIEDDMGGLVKNDGVMKTLEAGSTVKLPQEEAMRALQSGIASITNNSFS